MNFSLAREIYGRTTWMVDVSAFTALKSMFNDMRAGLSLQAKETKSNSIDIFDLKSATTIVTDTWQLGNDFKGDSLVYVINLNGVITKNGGQSTYGMKYLASQMAMLQADDRVIGGIMYIDSGGGSGSGMEVMMYAVSQRTKPLVSIVERGGMMASAAYGIASGTDWIIAESDKSIVGSIGTMAEIAGIPSGERNSDNAKEFRFYASKSFNKNKYFEEAINNDNGTVIIKEFLDPANDAFIKSIKKNRPSVLDAQMDGSIYDSGDVVGTLIDQLGSFQDALNKVEELSKSPKYSKNNITKLSLNNKNKAMTAQEFKSDHPAAYNEIFGAGVAAEKDRVGAWMAHAGTDLDAVKKGIESGEKLTDTARENFFVKQSALRNLEALKNSSAKDTVQPEAESIDGGKSEAENFYANINK